MSWQLGVYCVSLFLPIWTSQDVESRAQKFLISCWKSQPFKRLRGFCFSSSNDTSRHLQDLLKGQSITGHTSITVLHKDTTCPPTMHTSQVMQTCLVHTHILQYTMPTCSAAHSIPQACCTYTHTADAEHKPCPCSTDMPAAGEHISAHTRSCHTYATQICPVHQHELYTYNTFTNTTFTSSYIYTHSQYPCISQTFCFLIKVLKILVFSETHLYNSSTSFGLSFSFFTIFMDFFLFQQKSNKEQHKTFMLTSYK